MPELTCVDVGRGLWIGDPSDPPFETAGDMRRAVMLVVSSGLVFAALGVMLLLRWAWHPLRW